MWLDVAIGVVGYGSCQPLGSEVPHYLVPIASRPRGLARDLTDPAKGQHESELSHFGSKMGQFEPNLSRVLGKPSRVSFASAWTECEQNRLLALCFGAPQVKKPKT